jgi:hypothetical protein
MMTFVTIALTLTDEPNEFNLFLFVFMVMGLTIYVTVAAIGIGLGLLLSGAVIFLSLLGISVNAVAAGLVAKRPAIGLTAFVAQLGGLAGFHAGIGVFFLYRWLAGVGGGGIPEFLVTLTAGGAVGAMSAWLGWQVLTGLVGQLKDVVVDKRHTAA